MGSTSPVARPAGFLRAASTAASKARNACWILCECGENRPTWVASWHLPRPGQGSRAAAGLFECGLPAINCLALDTVKASTTVAKVSWVKK